MEKETEYYYVAFEYVNAMGDVQRTDGVISVQPPFMFTQLRLRLDREMGHPVHIVFLKRTTARDYNLWRSLYRRD